MDAPIDEYWRHRLENVKDALETNNFEAHLAGSSQAAAELVLNEIIPAAGAKVLSWGGSMTFKATGLYETLRGDPAFEIIDTYGAGSREDAYERRRRALLSDLFITGANAITEAGVLVNLDMYGNRAGAITFGPRVVVILAGRNKIVPDLDDAMLRIKNYAAPANAMRLDMPTPCVQTSYCQDCRSGSRICNVWTITEKSFPKGRIKVILINEDLGL